MDRNLIHIENEPLFFYRQLICLSNMYTKYIGRSTIEFFKKFFYKTLINKTQK